MISLLEYARSASLYPITVRLDSLLVVRQMRGEYRMNEALRDLYEAAQELIQDREVRFEWCPRLSNQAADELVNQAIDNRAEYHVTALAGSKGFHPLAQQLKHKHFASYPVKPIVEEIGVASTGEAIIE